MPIDCQQAITLCLTMATPLQLTVTHTYTHAHTHTRARTHTHTLTPRTHSFPPPNPAPQVIAHSMQANCSLGLQMFAQALPQMQESRELLESLLACEFVGLANFSQVGVSWCSVAPYSVGAVLCRLVGLWPPACTGSWRWPGSTKQDCGAC